MFIEEGTYRIENLYEQHGKEQVGKEILKTKTSNISISKHNGILTTENVTPEISRILNKHITTEKRN